MQVCLVVFFPDLLINKNESHNTVCSINAAYLSSSLLSLSVLDLNAFERQNKAEGLGMVTEEGSSK